MSFLGFVPTPDQQKLMDASTKRAGESLRWVWRRQTFRGSESRVTVPAIIADDRLVAWFSLRRDGKLRMHDESPYHPPEFGRDWGFA